MKRDVDRSDQEGKDNKMSVRIWATDNIDRLTGENLNIGEKVSDF